MLRNLSPLSLIKIFAFSLSVDTKCLQHKFSFYQLMEVDCWFPIPTRSYLYGLLALFDVDCFCVVNRPLICVMHLDFIGLLTRQ